MRDHGNVGDKLLPKIVSAVVQAVIHAKRGLAPLDHHVRVKATWDVFSRIGEELADHYGPLVDEMLAGDTSQMHPAVKQWLEDTRSGTDQAKAISGFLIGGAQSALGTFISNELAPITYAIVASNPNLFPDPAVLAQSVAARIDTESDGARVAASYGFKEGWWGTLRQNAFTWPGSADALEMRRRGLIDDNGLRLVLERNALPDVMLAPYAKLQFNELSLADAALAYLRSDITLDEARRIAVANGFNDDQLNVFIGNTGEPPGPDQLVAAFRRQIITKAELERGIKQSRIRNEWIPTLEALGHEPMSTPDAVNAVVQGHLSQPAAQVIADQNGLIPDQFGILVETAGEPLSRTEMEQLYNRGLVSEAEVKQALKESRLKNKYVDDAFALHIRLLEPRMLATAVQFGALTHDQAVKRALEYGYSEQDAQVLVNEGSARKLYTRRQQALTSAEVLYEDSAIDEAALREVAKQAGLDVAEQDEVIKLAEYKREAKWINSVINVIRSKYVSHHIGKAAATGYLDALGVPSARRDQLLVVWDMERAAFTAELTEAQIVKAHKLELITDANALERLINKGYSKGDAELLLNGA